MKRSILFIFFPTFFFLNRLMAQDEPIRLINPSFEGIPAEGTINGRMPDGWYDCGFPGETIVDVHPKADGGQFQVTTPAFHGKTYIGLVVRANDTWEMVSQRLNGTLQAGKCYEFSLSLARSLTYLSASRNSSDQVNYSQPIRLRIWGGSGYCNRTELLDETTPIINTNFKNYDFRFQPKQNHTYIVLEAFYRTPTPFAYNGNVLIDNAADIIPVPCDATTPEVADVPDKPKPGPKPPTPKPPKPNDDTPVVKRQPVILKELEDPAKLTKGQTIRIDQLYFPADSSTIKKTSLPVLSEVFNFLAANPNVVVEIGGHTNGIPAHEYCDRLSTERAKAVVDYLVNKGIARKRLQYKGYGKRNPVDSNASDAGRKRNQRVEIKILSTTG